MEELKELLSKVDTVSSKNEIESVFSKIAEDLMLKTEIKIGKDIRYTLEEIEFYYYKKGVFEEEYNLCTYPRDCNAGDFFWHYSGVDICFQSDETCYGGILIRSLTKEYKDNEGNLVKELIAGPLRCSNELINQGVLSNSIPQIKEIKWPTDRIVNVNNIGSTVRQGIETSERYNEILDEINNEDDRKDFPFFCYFIKRKKEENEWKTLVDGKWVKYSSIPEKRAKYIRSIV